MAEETGQEEQGTEETGSEEAATEEVSSEQVNEENDAPQETTTNWRETIADETLRKHAERFTSVDSLVQANLDQRKQASKAVVKPGENSTDDEIQAYREAMGVPKEASEYEFGEVSKEDNTERLQQSRQHWADVFHKHNISKESASEFVAEFHKELAAVQAERVEQDKAFTEKGREELKAEWKDDYEKNLIFAAKASEKMFGADYEDAKFIEDKSGNFVLDNPIFSRMMAKLGRQMGEGTMGSTVTESERTALQDKANGYRDKAFEAQRAGRTAEANKFSQLELDVLEQMEGSEPIVGAEYRSA